MQSFVDKWYFGIISFQFFFFFFSVPYITGAGCDACDSERTFYFFGGSKTISEYFVFYATL